MSEVNKLVNDIDNKVRKLISLQHLLKERNIALKNKHKELKQIIENQNTEIEKLKNTNRNLVIAKSVKHTEGNSDVKNRIDEIVREIDKCIGLLNK